MTDIFEALWGDAPYFETSHPTRGTARTAAGPAMAFWMVVTLLWLVDEALAREKYQRALTASRA